MTKDDLLKQAAACRCGICDACVFAEQAGRPQGQRTFEATPPHGFCKHCSRSREVHVNVGTAFYCEMPSSNEHLGKDRNELRGIIADRDAEIERLTRDLERAERTAAARNVRIGMLGQEKERLRAALEHIAGYLPGPVDDSHPPTFKEGCYCAGCASIRHAREALSGEPPSPVETSGELEQLRRIDRAARVYVDDRTHGNYSKLCDALFDGRPAVETSVPSPRFAGLTGEMRAPKAGDRCGHCGREWLPAPYGSQGVYHECHTGPSQQLKAACDHRRGVDDEGRCVMCSEQIEPLNGNETL